MTELQSNADAILVALPMLGILLLNFFRLDGPIAHRRRAKQRGELIGHWLSYTDQEGRFVCIEPDGCVSQGNGAWRRNRNARRSEGDDPGPTPRKKAQMLTRRVTPYWEEKDC